MLEALINKFAQIEDPAATGGSSTSCSTSW